MSARLARLLGALLLVLPTALVVVAADPPAAEAATWQVPRFVRSISGNGRPGVFPWGVQYNPVSGEVVVSDYLNNQVRRYSPDGRVLGSFYRADATGQPYSIGIDPRNGDIWVPEISDMGPANKVAGYTKDGTFIKALTLNGIDYQAWITVDGAGNLVQADSHFMNTLTNPPAVRVWRLSDGKQVRAFNVLPPGTTSATIPRIYGIDVDSAGNFWLTDTFNNRILKYSRTGVYLASYGVGDFNGDARGMALDEPRNRLYVSDPSVGEVRVYDLQGQPLGVLGAGTGTGPLDLGAARQPAVGPDGTVYVAEYGNARIHRFTADGQDAGYFPDPVQPGVAGLLGEPRDVDVDDETGDVWVADSWNQRSQRFTAHGEFVGTWGRRSASPTYGMNYPRGIGIDPDSRRVWVVNQRGHHIKRYEYDGTFVDQLGDAESDSTAPGSFRWPVDVEFHAGRALVTDRNGDRAKILDAATGAEVGQVVRFATSGGAIDPVTGDLFVADQTRIYRYDPTGRTLKASFGASGTANGQFRRIWDMVISNGVLYVTDDLASRVQAFSLDGTFLGKWGGLGQGAYQFRNPSGIATDAQGLLYVADAGNDRVLVFDPSLARGGAAWPPPEVSITAPGQGATVAGGPVRLTGTVTDETAVAAVEVAVQDVATGQWFDASNSTWSPTQDWAVSALVGATSSAMTWSWSFIGVEYSRTFRVEVRATDVAGNTSAVTSVDLSVAAADTDDVDPPVTVLTSPAPDSSVAVEPPLVLAGDSMDVTGVADVEVRVRKAGTGLFLQPDGTLSPTAAWLPGALAEPSTSSSAWSWTWADPQPGRWEVAARADDVLGNAGDPVVLGEFELTELLPPDTTAPTLVSVLPGPGAVLPAGAVSLSGRLLDDRAAATVDVAVKDKVTNLWLRADGTWGAFAWLPTTLQQPGGTDTAWQRDLTLPAGSWGYQVRAADAAGNTTSQPFRSFTTTG